MKKTLLTGIAMLLLATGTAHAADEPWTVERCIKAKIDCWLTPDGGMKPTRELGFGLPPKEFDHEYTGTLTVFKDTRQENLPSGCQIACARANHFGPNTCAIWIIKKDQIERRYSYDVVMRHEIAHCNGWHHDKQD